MKHWNETPESADALRGRYARNSGECRNNPASKSKHPARRLQLTYCEFWMFVGRTRDTRALDGGSALMVPASSGADVWAAALRQHRVAPDAVEAADPLAAADHAEPTPELQP